MVQCFNLQDATGVQCARCGKTYLREGWLHRHYKTFIGHDPGQFHLDENSVDWIKWYSECFNLLEATEMTHTYVPHVARYIGRRGRTHHQHACYTRVDQMVQ